MAGTGYTIGDFASALHEITDLLDNIAGDLGHCNLDAAVDKTPGKTVICSLPVFMAEMCRAPAKDDFTVRDLLETVEGLKGWVLDIESKLTTYDGDSPLEDGLRPPSDTA